MRESSDSQVIQLAIRATRILLVRSVKWRAWIRPGCSRGSSR